MKAVECVDPGGLIANLPTNPLNNCDGQTVLSTSAVNADGSFSINGYTVYWLPDNATFGESASNKPTCGTVPNYCVLYIGPNQLDFSKPHIFSAPFAVQNNGDDGGENPGDGSAPAQTGTDATKSTVVATPSLPVADGENVAKVTVSLKDAAGDPVTSTDQVTLSQGAGSNATILYDGSPGTVGTSDPSTGVVQFHRERYHGRARDVLGHGHHRLGADRRDGDGELRGPRGHRGQLQRRRLAHHRAER